jgi:hypothetical protein
MLSELGSAVIATFAQDGFGKFSQMRRVQWVPGVKRPGREVDHSKLVPEVKKTWVYTSSSPYAFMA